MQVNWLVSHGFVTGPSHSALVASNLGISKGKGDETSTDM